MSEVNPICMCESCLVEMHDDDSVFGMRSHDNAYFLVCKECFKNIDSITLQNNVGRNRTATEVQQGLDQLDREFAPIHKKNLDAICYEIFAPLTKRLMEIIEKNVLNKPKGEE